MENLYRNGLELYKQLDDTIEAHFLTHKKQAPCAKGCSSCCSQFFEISELEFMLMFEAIDNLPDEKKSLLADKAQALFSLFKEYWPSFYEDYFTPETSTIHTDEYYQHPERFKVNNHVCFCLMMAVVKYTLIVQLFVAQQALGINISLTLDLSATI